MQIYDSVFKHKRTIKATTSFQAAASYGGVVYSVQAATASAFQGFNLSDGSELSYKGVTITSSINNGSMVMVNNGASAVWDTSSNNQLNFVQISTGYYSQLTTGSPAFAISYKGQTIAWNPRNSSGRYIVKIGSSTAGALSYFDTTTWAVTNVGSLGGGSGDGFYAIIPHPTSANFIVSQATSSGAANNPRIKEFSFNGTTFTLQKTISVDMSKIFPASNASAGKLVLSSIAMSTDGTYLVAGDSKGIVYLIDYATGTVLDRIFLQGSASISSGDGIVLSTIASGIFAATSGGGDSTLPKDISIVRIDPTYGTLQVLEHQPIISGDTSKVVDFDETSGTMWVMANNQYIHVYDIPMPYTSTVQTRIQEPAGTDKAGRIIRIRNLPTGKSYVDQDVQIGAGAEDVDVGQPGDYYEIALTGSGATLKWDWRRFNL